MGLQRDPREVTSQVEPAVRVTEAARAKVLEVLATEEGSERLALWVEVRGQVPGQYQYDLYFQARDDAGGDDLVQYGDELSLVVPSASVPKLRGSTLDVSDDGGLVVSNPNVPPAPASPAISSVPPADLSGDLAQRVIQVLEYQINPQIAAHGGRADLVAVEDGTAYLRLGGGCQGCGMATVTLSQGIDVALREAVPEITSVVDVTDHATGSNPYYEPAKK